MIFLIRVTVHWCYMCHGFHIREHGQSALTLPHVAATLEALHTKLLLKCSRACDFTLDLCSRLGIFHSETCNTILHKSGEDSMLNHFNCKRNC